MSDWIKLSPQDAGYRTELDIQLERIADALTLLALQNQTVFTQGLADLRLKVIRREDVTNQDDADTGGA